MRATDRIYLIILGTPYARLITNMDDYLTHSPSPMPVSRLL